MYAGSHERYSSSEKQTNRRPLIKWATNLNDSSGTIRSRDEYHCRVVPAARFIVDYS